MITRALAVTPADIRWYLDLFPGRESVIESLKDRRLIVVVEENNNV